MAWSIRRSLKEPETLRWLADHSEAVDKFQVWSKAWKPVEPAPPKAEAGNEPTRAMSFHARALPRDFC